MMEALLILGLSILALSAVVGYMAGARERYTVYQATITLLPDGGLIFGVPATVSPEQMVGLRDGLTKWLEKKGPLVLPWPTEVRDLRQPSFGQQYR